MTTNTRPEWVDRVRVRLNELDTTWGKMAKGIGVSDGLFSRAKTGSIPLSARVRHDMAIWLHRTEVELFEGGKGGK